MLTKRRVEEIQSVEKLGKIVFRALDPKKQQPVTVRPLEDATGKLYTGQGKFGYYELLSAEEKLNGFVFDHKTKYVIENGKVLNIDTDPLHAALWKWIQVHPYVGMSKEECLSNKDAVFYVDNPVKTAESYVSRDKKVTKLKTTIYNATLEQKITIAKALGLTGADGLSPTQLEEWLIIKTMEIPDAVEELMSPSNSSYAIAMGIAKELVNYGIIKIFGGVYKYGGNEGIRLGISEGEVAQWIANTENEPTVIVMMSELNEKKGL
jgi:hypothetical protein